MQVRAVLFVQRQVLGKTYFLSRKLYVWSIRSFVASGVVRQAQIGCTHMVRSGNAIAVGLDFNP